MKRILMVFLMLLLWTGICSASNYQYLMTDNRGEHFIDLDATKHVPNNQYKDLVKVKTKVVLNEEFKKQRSTKADYFIETYIIDRDTKDYYHKLIDEYDVNNNQISSYEFPVSWKYYGTDGYKKEFIKKILENIKEGK
jgi:hypothetical protein